jgi:hypothetical protein
MPYRLLLPWTPKRYHNTPLGVYTVLNSGIHGSTSWYINTLKSLKNQKYTTGASELLLIPRTHVATSSTPYRRRMCLLRWWYGLIPGACVGCIGGMALSPANMPGAMVVTWLPLAHLAGAPAVRQYHRHVPTDMRWYAGDEGNRCVGGKVFPSSE